MTEEDGPVKAYCLFTYFCAIIPWKRTERRLYRWERKNEIQSDTALKASITLTFLVIKKKKKNLIEIFSLNRNTKSDLLKALWYKKKKNKQNKSSKRNVFVFPFHQLEILNMGKKSRFDKLKKKNVLSIYCFVAKLRVKTKFIF